MEMARQFSHIAGSELYCWRHANETTPSSSKMLHMDSLVRHIEAGSLTAYWNLLSPPKLRVSNCTTRLQRQRELASKSTLTAMNTPLGDKICTGRPDLAGQTLRCRLP